MFTAFCDLIKQRPHLARISIMNNFKYTSFYLHYNFKNKQFVYTVQKNGYLQTYFIDPLKVEYAGFSLTFPYSICQVYPSWHNYTGINWA